MKRQTFVDYAKIIIISLVITIFTSIFGLVGYIVDNKNSYTLPTALELPEGLTIIIDAGHGGEDGGAVGISDTLEKDINLSVAKYLSKLFVLTDIDVVMTRDGDYLLYEAGQESRKKFNDLNNRIKICNSFENPLLISIHQNKFPLEKYRGLQVYYSDNSKESALLANIIQNKTKEFLQNDNNRKIKAGGRNIFILNKAEFPAVLIECGFLSNSEDERNLINDEYQRKIAYIIFSSTIEHISANY